MAAGVRPASLRSQSLVPRPSDTYTRCIRWFSYDAADPHLPDEWTWSTELPHSSSQRIGSLGSRIAHRYHYASLRILGLVVHLVPLVHPCHLVHLLVRPCLEDPHVHLLAVPFSSLRVVRRQRVVCLAVVNRGGCSIGRCCLGRLCCPGR